MYLETYVQAKICCELFQHMGVISLWQIGLCRFVLMFHVRHRLTCVQGISSGTCCNHGLENCRQRDYSPTELNYEIVGDQLDQRKCRVWFQSVHPLLSSCSFCSDLLAINHPKAAHGNTSSSVYTYMICDVLEET